ncbi:MAG: sigma-70 family RNA polymerase sigma factor [Candidatus Delongbacteria bacterium]
MLPTKRAQAYTPESIAHYQALATEEAALPATMEAFLALLGPEGKGRHDERRAALAAVIQRLQAGHPTSASIQLWLLVSYNPPLHSLVGRYGSHGRDSQADLESAVVLAFLEVLQTLSTERLADPYLEKRIMDDARRRLMVLLGIRDYQQADRVETVADESVQDDRAADEREDGYESLLVQINDLPITDGDRDLLVGIYVYGYNMAELAEQWHIPHDTIKKRYQRLLGRLKKNM